MARKKKVKEKRGPCIGVTCAAVHRQLQLLPTVPSPGTCAARSTTTAAASAAAAAAAAVTAIAIVLRMVLLLRDCASADTGQNRPPPVPQLAQPPDYIIDQLGDLITNESNGADQLVRSMLRAGPAHSRGRWLKSDDESAAKPQPAQKRNVLFIAVDDLRFELGSAGGPGVAGPGCSLLEGRPCAGMHTPNFDDLAARSTVFDKNYVQQAVCSCSRTSLLTSRRPDATRVWDLFSYWRDVSGNFTSAPQWFREQGFRTIGLGKVFHPGHASGLNVSTGRLGDDMGAGPGSRSWSDPYFHAPNRDYWETPNRSWVAVTPEDEARHPLPDSQLAAHAETTLRQLRLDQLNNTKVAPFFLAVGFHKPHVSRQ